MKNKSGNKDWESIWLIKIFQMATGDRRKPNGSHLPLSFTRSKDVPQSDLHLNLLLNSFKANVSKNTCKISQILTGTLWGFFTGSLIFPLLPQTSQFLEETSRIHCVCLQSLGHSVVKWWDSRHGNLNFCKCHDGYSKDSGELFCESFSSSTQIC